MKITVVIPIYNEAAFLGACLDSLAVQTRLPHEVIVVDNNSSDGSADLARRYDVQVIHEAEQGIMPAVYAGFEASTGDIIARCDADSILPPDWLEQIAQTLSSQPAAAGVTGPGRFYGTGRLAARAAQVWYMYPYFLLVGSALANWPLFGSNCALRREVWLDIRQAVHRHRADIHDDIDLSIHLSPRQRVLFAQTLQVGISARSLARAGMRSRYKKGMTTILMHWPAQAPWKRWADKLSAL